MEQNVSIILLSITTVVAVVTAGFTFRRDRKAEQKQRNEDRDRLTRMDMSLSDLAKSNREVCSVMRNHEGRLIRLETRIFPHAEWESFDIQEEKRTD